MNKLFTYAGEALLNGGVAVIPTDTLYGIVARASDVVTVERVYRIRGRDPKKPVIVLIQDASDLSLFGIALSHTQKKYTGYVWPGKVSVVLSCTDEKFAHLHRGGCTIAFRVPNYAPLRALLKKTGPLIAPSANPEGKQPAQTIKEARAYFGDRVDAYCDGGTLAGIPSTLVSLTGDTPNVLRDGSANI